jgi:hypothetical protein
MSKNPTVLNVIYHRQNPLKSTSYHVCVPLDNRVKQTVISPEAALVLKSDHTEFYSIHIHQSWQPNAIMSR